MPTISSTPVSAIKPCRRIGQAQAPRTQRDLGERLLAGGVQHRPQRVERRGRLQHQGGFTDARVAADQGHRARYEPTAAEHPIEFRGARCQARLLGDRLGGQ